MSSFHKIWADWTQGKNLRRGLLISSKKKTTSSSRTPSNSTTAIPKAQSRTGIWRYLDAIYDPALKRVQIHASSLIYGVRQKERNDLRLPEKTLQAVFNKAGICLEVVGHTPVGSGAMVLRAEEKINFMRLHVDTSFTKVREHSLTVFNPQNCHH